MREFFLFSTSARPCFVETVYDIVERLFAKYGIVVNEIKSKPGRLIVGVMSYPRFKGRVEKDESERFFGVCGSCDYESPSAASFDGAYKALTGHRGHCSGIQNTGESSK